MHHITLPLRHAIAKPNNKNTITLKAKMPGSKAK